MLKKVKTVEKLVDAGVIAVFRGKDKTEAIKAAHALIKGGIKGIEVTFTVPQADQIIAEIANHYKNDASVIVGAGTVLDIVTARIAIMAGASFIVSPAFDREIAELCNLYQVPYSPGCMTITEMQTALKSGVDIIKLFPGSAYGSDIIKAIKAPLPQANIMPTGGVSLENMAEWFNAGVVAVGVGGNLLKPAEVGDFDAVTKMAKQYIDKLKEIRKK